MYREYEEIANLLAKARNLMEERPELLQMPKEDILEALDDGSREMLGCRWGVIAYAYVKELTDFSLPAIVEAVKDIKSGDLTYEYIGFILQSEYDINLVDLLLMANEMGAYDKILPFVKSNLPFEMTFAQEKIDAFLEAYEDFDEQKNHIRLMQLYAGLVVKFCADEYLCKRLIDTQDEKYYNLMLYVCNELYDKSCERADTYMEVFLGKDHVVCKKLAIEFVYRSLRIHNEAFEAHFEEWDNLAEESDTYWSMLIPVYATYLQKNENSACYEPVLNRLKVVIKGSIEDKRAFLCQLQYKDSISKDMEAILDAILGEDFGKDGTILEVLDWIFFKNLTQGKEQDVLMKMQQVFSVNGYKNDWDDFFDAFDSVQEKLKSNQSLLLETVMQKICNGSESEFYFAIGLFRECVSWKVISKNRTGRMYSEEEAELVLLGLLYNIFEPKKVCEAAFYLPELVDGKCEKYIACCAKELYENYPYTMNDYAGVNLHSENKNVRKLANMIMKLHQKRLEHVELGTDVLDLRPSQKRMEVYQRAVWEQKRKVNQISNQKSVFANLFAKNVMKYGKRNAYIQVGRGNKWTFQVSNYAEISYEVELPRKFMKDQLLLLEMRREYMERREQYALNH